MNGGFESEVAVEGRRYGYFVGQKAEKEIERSSDGKEQCRVCGILQPQLEMRCQLLNPEASVDAEHQPLQLTRDPSCFQNLADSGGSYTVPPLCPLGFCRFFFFCGSIPFKLLSLALANFKTVSFSQ